MVRAFGALRSYFEIGTDDWAHRPLIHSLRRELTIDHFHRAEGPIHSIWGNAPGMETITRRRAEGPVYADAKTVLRGSCAIMDMLPHVLTA